METRPKQEHNHLTWFIAILIPIISTSAGIWLTYSTTLATIEVANACYNKVANACYNNTCTIFAWLELLLTPRDLWWWCKFCVQGVRIIYAVAREWIMDA